MRVPPDSNAPPSGRGNSRAARLLYPRPPPLPEPLPPSSSHLLLPRRREPIPSLPSSHIRPPISSSPPPYSSFLRKQEPTAAGPGRASPQCQLPLALNHYPLLPSSKRNIQPHSIAPKEAPPNFSSTPKYPSGNTPHSFPPPQQTNPKLRTKTGSFPPPEKNEKRKTNIPTTPTNPCSYLFPLDGDLCITAISAPLISSPILETFA